MTTCWDEQQLNWDAPGLAAAEPQAAADELAPNYVNLPSRSPWQFDVYGDIRRFTESHSPRTG
jgi:hypothetical protein